MTTPQNQYPAQLKIGVCLIIIVVIAALFKLYTHELKEENTALRQENNKLNVTIGQLRVTVDAQLSLILTAGSKLKQYETAAEQIKIFVRQQATDLDAYAAKYGYLYTTNTTKTNQPEPVIKQPK